VTDLSLKFLSSVTAFMVYKSSMYMFVFVILLMTNVRLSQFEFLKKIFNVK